MSCYVIDDENDDPNPGSFYNNRPSDHYDHYTIHYIPGRAGPALYPDYDADVRSRYTQPPTGQACPAPPASSPAPPSSQNNSANATNTPTYDMKFTKANWEKMKSENQQLSTENQELKSANQQLKREVRSLGLQTAGLREQVTAKITKAEHEAKKAKDDAEKAKDEVKRLNNLGMRFWKEKGAGFKNFFRLFSSEDTAERLEEIMLDEYGELFLPREMININVRSHLGVVPITIRPSCTMKKLMQTYSLRTGINCYSAKFLIEGSQLRNNATADRVGLEDGDTLIFVGYGHPHPDKQPNNKPKRY